MISLGLAKSNDDYLSSYIVMSIALNLPSIIFYLSFIIFYLQSYVCS
jgi:hypothetical protein